MPAFGAIQSAVNNRAGMGEIIAAIRGAYEAMPGPTPTINPVDVSQLRSYAAGIRNATAAFAAANPEWSLDSSMIAQTPWGRDLAAQAAAPDWQVRFLADVTDELGNSTQLWRSVLIPGTLPASKQALLDEVEAAAQAMADEYGVTHSGIGAVQILAR